MPTPLTIHALSGVEGLPSYILTFLWSPKPLNGIYLHSKSEGDLRSYPLTFLWSPKPLNGIYLHSKSEVDSCSYVLTLLRSYALKV